MSSSGATRRAIGGGTVVRVTAERARTALVDVLLGCVALATSLGAMGHGGWNHDGTATNDHPLDAAGVVLALLTALPLVARRAQPVAVLAVVTLGVYLVCWWYFINRELADLGRAKGTTELGDSPAKSTLALFPGALLIVPAIWTTVTTFQRVQAAQRLNGQAQINGWLGVVLYIVISPVLYAYMQSGLNSVWKAQASETAPAVA